MVEPQFINDYVATGKVSFEFRDFPVLGDESNQAAQASFCALDQGKFWQYHDTLFANQQGEHSGAFSGDRLKEIAAAIGLDTKKFNSCYDSGQFKDDVQASVSDGASQGVHQTPTLMVDGKDINYSGYQSLQNAINQALQK